MQDAVELRDRLIVLFVGHEDETAQVGYILHLRVAELVGIDLLEVAESVIVVAVLDQLIAPLDVPSYLRVSAAIQLALVSELIVIERNKGIRESTNTCKAIDYFYTDDFLVLDY
jgi:hypothetical protein